MEPGGKVRIIEESAETRIPSDEEVREYAGFLEIDVDTEPHLMWIAQEGVVAPVPHPWKMCTENDEDFFYFNFETGESAWDHPCDEKYRQMVHDYRAKAAQGDSVEESMTSKLESSGELNSVMSPTSLPPPSQTPVPEDTASKLDISRDGSGLHEEVCKFDQDSLLSSVASPGQAEANSSQREIVVEKVAEVSDEESGSSESISGPRSPKSSKSPKSAASNCSNSRSTFEEAVKEAPKASSDAALLAPRLEGAGGGGLETTPQRGLLEAYDMDVVVDLAACTPEAAGRRVDEGASASVPSSRTTSLENPLLKSSTGPGGDDAAGRAPSVAALDGWRNLAGPLVAEAAPQANGLGDGHRDTPSPKAVAAWQQLAEPLVAEVSAAADRPQRSESRAKSGGSSAPSEVSDDYPSEFAGSSPSASHLPSGGRSSPVCETPEPASATTREAAADAVGTKVGSSAHGGAAALVGSIAQKQPLGRWERVEEDLESLTRCLAMLREIREKQSKYLSLLHG